MPRKDFLRDLEQAVAPGHFPCISNIRAGECDGSISFTFTEPKKSITLDLQAIVSGKKTMTHTVINIVLTENPDSHDYPNYHSYLIFSTSENCPPTVTSSLEDAGSFFKGSTIDGLLSNVPKIIANATFEHDSAFSFSEEEHTPDSNECEPASDDDEPNWESDDEGTLFGPTQPESELRKKIRRDLREAKIAGFKIGYLGSAKGIIVVSVSCRIVKLGISEEAMDAWNVKPAEYVVLLIRYIPAYQDLQMVIDLGSDAKSARIQMHVGLCDSYKPSLEHATMFFQDTQGQGTKSKSQTSNNVMKGHPLKRLFNGESLDSLLGERLLGIVKLRLQYGFSWTGAELFFQTHQGMSLSDSNTSLPEYHQPDSWATSTPSFLAADHVAKMDHNVSNISLPLLAMQFTLRHFVKCTEFCLVCHCKTGDTFEAIKPYVCSNGLCLYQYMALGMAPSIEYEITSQPFVVDLLISLAYSRATSWQLMDFPTGLQLRVPIKILQRDPDSNEMYTGRLSYPNLELQISQRPPVHVGDWIVICGKADYCQSAESDEDWHCRVEHVAEYTGHLILATPICQGRKVQSSALQRNDREVWFAVYDTNLDDLTISQKQKMVSLIVGILPDVHEMKSFIESPKNQLLSTWKQVISPAALGMLRWVVASNRSFIKKDDNAPQHQVVGMSDFVQFRLVQGAADKEQRFTDAVNSVSLTPKPNHPTLFAWHGSSVKNWHSILREGLHYHNNVTHGRAYGDGIYMSNHFHVSRGYTHGHGLSWPKSRLKISTVISLNEVVNAPERFVCSAPHYVVQHLDWVQPRYLFVKAKDTSEAMGLTSHPSQIGHQGRSLFYKQDQKHVAVGPGGTPIEIPISILSGQRGKFLCDTARARLEELESPSKRRKYMVEDDEEHENGDNISIETDMEDIQILLSDDQSLESHAATTVKNETAPDTDPKTGYYPGLLQEESLPLLSPPEYATTPATKILQQHLAATIKIQKQVPLHHLGWYVDHNLITTVYQWIVELHSFDPELLLAKDLQAVGMQSIVLELRFPPQFPMDPPFVRVIRPRFLQFSLGGGGHVTAGGALCMELLTQSGWLPTASIESVLLQVRMAILNTDPRPARLQLNTSNMHYSVGEAVADYKRVSLAHGWQISEDIQQLAW
ncbi:Ubiquitin-conjugating enzyme E2 [Penicillium soppii]|uniref:Ubiquitin-conjugating enzyme E2 n=1 Tax=Penicillium soppii TaxID=69789 RepID=UPI002547F4B6|nr:Ubiquitin-conjugating enzyme E2 [Penicillium soppii]KAJ5864397.1 Ubiquitin-conjugating enzyme E2 [Penicillium soppii]